MKISNRCLSACEVIKPIERLVLVSYTCCHASTPSLSTWWSTTVLKRDLVSRGDWEKNNGPMDK